jgi:hypothetical protein
MREPSFGEKILVLLGIGISAAGFVWLVTITKPPEAFLRLGLLSAIISCSGLLVICWGACWAYMARKRNWSWRACGWAAVPFWAAAVLVLFLTQRDPFFVVTPLAGLGALAGFVARKLAFPQLTDEQVAASPAPPSLFPK